MKTEAKGCAAESVTFSTIESNLLDFDLSDWQIAAAILNTQVVAQIR